MFFEVGTWEIFYLGFGLFWQIQSVGGNFVPTNCVVIRWEEVIIVRKESLVVHLKRQEYTL